MSTRCSSCAVKPWNSRSLRKDDEQPLRLRITFRNGLRFDLLFEYTMISSATVKSKIQNHEILLAFRSRTAKFRGIAFPLTVRWNPAVSTAWFRVDESQGISVLLKECERQDSATRMTLLPRISRKSLRFRAIVRNCSLKFCEFYRRPSFSDDLNSEGSSTNILKNRLLLYKDMIHNIADKFVFNYCVMIILNYKGI